MGVLGRADDHQWSQQHLSHYVEGDLRPRARRRLDRHARDCVDCGRGIRAIYRAKTTSFFVQVWTWRQCGQVIL